MDSIVHQFLINFDKTLSNESMQDEEMKRYVKSFWNEEQRKKIRKEERETFIFIISKIKSMYIKLRFLNKFLNLTQRRNKAQKKILNFKLMIFR